MTRQEFLEILGRALRRELSEAEVMENLRYYEDYIAREIAGGKTEEQVLGALGDPRLIARTILQVDNGGGPREDYRDDSDYGNEFEFEGSRVRVHKFGWKAWCTLILVLVIVFLVLGTMFAILWKLLPVILILAGISWLYRRFFS